MLKKGGTPDMDGSLERRETDYLIGHTQIDRYIKSGRVRLWMKEWW